MDFYPFIIKYSVKDALLLGVIYDEIDNTELWLKVENNPKVTYSNLMRSILNEFERDIPASILEFLRAYVLWLTPEAEQQVITWINYPEEPNNPIKELILKWHNRINGLL